MNKDTPFQDFIGNMHINDYRIALLRRLIKRVVLGYFIGATILIVIKRLMGRIKAL